MNTLIFSVGFEKDYIKQCNTGWGCGYIMIPLNHPFLIAMQAIEDEAYKRDRERYYFTGYQIPRFSEEITLCEDDELEGVNYKLLGFDCAHSWNNIENSDRKFVISKTLEMQRIVESYK